MARRDGAYLPPVTADAVIDISHHQRDADFAAAKAAGIAAVILKASQGVSWVDPVFVERAEAVVKAGLLLGAYHFLDGSDSRAQADHFFDTVAGCCAGALLALDLERSPAGTSATPDQAASAAERIHGQTGRWPVIYVGRWSLPAPHPVLARCPLWLPEYGSDPVCPPGWRRWHLWQHTDGRAGLAPLPVPGIGRCDRSRYAGPSADLARWWAGAGR